MSARVDARRRDLALSLLGGPTTVIDIAGKRICDGPDLRSARRACLLTKTEAPAAAALDSARRTLRRFYHELSVVLNASGLTGVVHARRPARGRSAVVPRGPGRPTRRSHCAQDNSGPLSRWRRGRLKSSKIVSRRGCLHDGRLVGSVSLNWPRCDRTNWSPVNAFPLGRRALVG